MVGTQTGKLKFYDRFTAAEKATYKCHGGYLNSVQPNRSGDLLLTSGTIRPPYSCLWSVRDLFGMKCAFNDEEYVEFSKSVQDIIVGTKGETATIYDVATGKTVLKLTPTSPNYYSKNRATFHPSDDGLILSDGILWDATWGKPIHKFNKFEKSFSGTFHPNGIEMISSSAVWDIRTFRLLPTVPALHQCKVSFSNNGDVIYAVPPVAEDESKCYVVPVTSFKTLDARDYSSIATIDVKRRVFELCTNKNDTQIAIMENVSAYDNSPGKSIVRLYDIGRSQDDEDLVADVEDEYQDTDIDSTVGDSDNDDGWMYL